MPKGVYPRKAKEPAKKKDYSTSWFLDFMSIAASEDNAGGGTVANPYETVAWVNIAISRRAKNISRAEWKLYNASGDTEIDSGREWELFHNGYLSLPQLWEATEGWRCIRGESFWILGWGGIKGFPKQIVIPDPMSMLDKRDETGKVVVWYYSDSKGLKIPFAPEEVIHFPTWNTRDWVRGQSEMTPLQAVIDTEALSDRGQKRLLQNNSVPGGVISIPGDFANSEEAQKIIDKWERKHQGTDRAGKVAVLSSGATYQRISLTPQELQNIDSRKWNRETILAKWGVPKALVGVSDGSPLSGKDTSDQMKVFWQQTLIPELEYFEEKVNKDLFRRYNVNLVGEFDTEDIPELQEDQGLLRTMLRADVVAGILTQNEAREVIGMDPVDWGDVFWKPLSLEPVTSGEPIPAPVAPDALPPDQNMPVQNIFEPPAIKAKGRPALYATAYREMHWKAQIDPWENLEVGYAKKIKDWLFRMRQANITRIMTTGNWQELRHTVIAELTGDPLWADRAREIRDISKPFFVKAVDIAGDALKPLFSDIGIGRSFNIWDTRAVEMMNTRVNKVSDITETVRDQVRTELQNAIEGGWSEQETATALKERYNIAQNRAPMIARTEIGGVINDSRIAGFQYVGIQRHEWLSAKDERVRQPPDSPYNHAIDGEVRHIEQPFSNGLFFPGDPGGEPGNVINCRCLTLPVFEEDTQGAQIVEPDIVKVAQDALDSAVTALRKEIADSFVDLKGRIEAAEKKEPKQPIEVKVNPQVTVNMPEPLKPGRTVFEQDEWGNIIAAHPENEHDQ